MSDESPKPVDETRLPEARQAGEPPLIERSYESRVEMKVRHSELKSISERLEHVAALSRAEKWSQRSQLLIGGLGGGAVGLIPFLASKPATGFVIVYLAALLIALLLALLHRDAAADIAAERADSIVAIKDHIDQTMLTTETPRLQAPARRVAPGQGGDRSLPPSSPAGD